MSRRPPRGGPADEPPIEIDVIEGNAYVWTVPAVRRLRERHRLVGAMAGGLAGYKSQVAVRGLPLRLSKEEATLALSSGWAVVAPAPPAVARLRVVAGGPGSEGQASARASASAGSKKRPREPEAHACAHGAPHEEAEDEDEGAYADYYAQYYGEGGAGTAAAAGEEEEDDEEDDAEDGDNGAPRPWTDAVATGAHMDLPTTAAEAEALNARVGGGGRRRKGAEGAGGEDDDAAAAAAAGPPPPPQSWPFPSTPYERLRAAVFADLHGQGFTLTDGSKFGGDYLAYPGDPFVYHAQFVVRVLPPSTNGEGAVRPTLLKAWARGVHGARKHLLLATAADPRELSVLVDAEGKGPKVAPSLRLRYLTIAKESGFVSSAAAAGPPAEQAAAAGGAPENSNSNKKGPAPAAGRGKRGRGRGRR